MFFCALCIQEIIPGQETVWCHEGVYSYHAVLGPEQEIGRRYHWTCWAPLFGSQVQMEDLRCDHCTICCRGFKHGERAIGVQRGACPARGYWATERRRWLAVAHRGCCASEDTIYDLFLKGEVLKRQILELQRLRK